MRLTLLALILCFAYGFAQDPGVVHHPVPKEPIYLKASWYDTLKSQVSHPPQKDSAEQRWDEEELAKAQKNRTPKDCERAKSEIFVSLKNFFGSAHGLLDDSTTEQLSPFFEQLRNDGDFFIQKLKQEFPRERPFLYVRGIEPCVAKEVTGAYPSGHAVLSKLYSLVLIDLFPKLKGKLEARANLIAQDRVLSGMHHPSDIEAGKKAGVLVFEELKKSKKFQDDLKKIKSDLIKK